jgi:hypothetical protein
LATVGFNSDESVYAGQGAALFGIDPYPDLLSLFRAHPLFLQAVMGVTFSLTGVADIAGRAVVAILFGAGAVLATFLLGRVTHDTRTGVLAAVIVAVLPYHVILSRQVLVDTAMACLFTWTLFALAMALRSRSGIWFIAAATLAGLTTLTKEVAILLVPAVFALFILGRRGLLFPLRTWAIAAAAYIVTVVPFAVSRLLGPKSNASEFVLWQFSRPANHDPDYFLRVGYQFIGPAVAALGVFGLILALRRRSMADLLLLLPFVVFMTFFQLWPTKLFSYLLPLVPILAIFAATTAFWLLDLSKAVGTGRWSLVGTATITLVVSLSAATAWAAVSATPERPTGFVELDVELQDFAGAREAAEWARFHTPSNSRFMTIGPSLGNILRFYGHRDSVALSVSPDPTRRNPAYVPIPNPDRAIRDSSIDYIIWDAYSADRSAFYNGRLMRYVRKFAGLAVFSAYVTNSGEIRSANGPPPRGSDARVVIYSVVGGNPDAPAHPADQ